MKIFRKLFFILLTVAVAVYFVRALDSKGMMQLYAEHGIELSSEYRAGTEINWAGYLTLENALSADLEDALSSRGQKFKDLNRHAPAGVNNADTYIVNFNKSYALQPASLEGSAVLLHGLTDSPYSVRSTAALFQQQGFHTFAPRLPGHGYAVGALRHVHWQDWMDIVIMTMRKADKTRQAGQPLVLGGYSNGGILALQYAIDCQADPDMPCPDAILLLSPAIKVSPFAIFARLHSFVSWLDYFEQFQWESVYPEIDPYKYTSFPKNAGWETAELSWSVRNEIETGALTLPPVLAFQSVVDSTVDGRALLKLFEDLPPNQHHLVLYDVNRSGAISEWFNVDLRSVDEFERDSPYTFSISMLTNTDDNSLSVIEKQISEGAQIFEVIDTNLQWPKDVYSLSHIALPFPIDDPVYGQEGSAVGAHALKGEKQVMTIGADYFLRLRYNPFHRWQEEKIVSWLQLLTGTI